LAWITPFDTSFDPYKGLKEISLVVILPDPDLKKLEKLANDVQEEIKKSKDWKLETEDYKGRKIYKAIPTEKNIYWSPPGEPKLEPSTTLTNGHFVLASKPEDIKKIIDVAEDQKITKIFKKDRIKNINAGIAYKKIKKYLPKDYLAVFYGEFDWSKILKTAEGTKTVKETEKILPPLTASLKAALNLPFFKGKEIKEPEKVAFAATIIAEKNEIKMESYSLDTREDAFLPSQFSLKESLAGFLPEKIGNREVASYGEGRNLKRSFEYLEKEMTAKEKEDFDLFLKEFKEAIGVDLKEDILALMDKNYAFYSASEPTGKEMPVIAFITEVDNENKIKENLLKIKVPKIPSIEESLEQSRLKAKDARIMADMSQLRTMAEIIHSEKNTYKNVSCLHNQIKPICQDINKQIGGWYPIIYQSRDNYCAYTKLTEPNTYYCIDSKGAAEKTDIDPGNYCTRKTFVCPKTGGTAPAEKIIPEEKVGFSKETIEGFEVYSLPVFENLGLNFAIRDKKLILTFTKDGLVNILKSLSDPNQKKLKDSQIFAEEFKEIPKDITGISYLYPYGFLGITKSLVNSLVNYLAAFVPPEELKAGPSPEFILSTVNEFLDRGVAPYLKLLKTASSYSYSPEKGLFISKGRLTIGELSAGEKKETENFWENIQKWLEEKFAPLMLMPSPITPPIY